MTDAAVTTHQASARKSTVGGSFAECPCGWRRRKETFPAARRLAEKHNAGEVI